MVWENHAFESEIQLFMSDINPNLYGLDTMYENEGYDTVTDCFRHYPF